MPGFNANQPVDVVPPSAEELERRRIVGINAETVTAVTSTDFPHHYPYEDHSWNLSKFADNLKIQFHTNAQHDASFSLIGVDASIANAFRRILIAEIPTLAIETAYVFNNTSVIQDEVLAARLGLVPLKGSKAGLNWLRWYKKPTEDEPEASVPSDYNTVVLGLDVECTWHEKGKERAKRGETDPKRLYVNSSVYAHQLEFQPTGQQVQYFKDEPIAPVNPDILLAKMRPGQAIKIEMHCVKGLGGDHAKFSPVATASYRLLPTINIISPIVGADARKFARCFPKGVIGLEPVTAEEASRANSGYEGHEGEVKAVVKDPMKDTVSRECLRHEEFKNKVKLGRVRDHFIFRIESTGQWDSDELFLESVKVLKLKCQRMRRGLDEIMR
ncbi:DNA-directed RNA polymerase core subunit rpc40 [Coniosporium tulheliwenetii]|uniref:DNA-directed RNA polymerase core subunit rpc40 n=1 Tax=Coniosporium tulheliwenetii TaxID=3383036 RepID=A0ACC2ZLR2_9PEZI|nr:DNA-directed RNA polymerase core subunit rpc40 [Cladosporium sp. JES 115]